MTAGKMDLIKNSMMPLDQFIHEQVEHKEYPFQWDLLTATVLIKPLTDHGLRANPKEIQNAFARLGYFKLGQLGDDKVNMWAVRDFKTYAELSNSQLRQAWMAQVNGKPQEPDMALTDALVKNSPNNPLKSTESM